MDIISTRKKVLGKHLMSVWIREKLAQNLLSQNLFLTFSLDSKIKIKKVIFESVVSEIVNKEMTLLKSYVVEEQDIAFRKIDVNFTFKLNCININEAFTEKKFNECIQDLMLSRFDVKKPPLFKILLLSFLDKNFLIFKFHKIVADDHYINKFLKILEEKYFKVNHVECRQAFDKMNLSNNSDSSNVEEITNDSNANNSNSNNNIENPLSVIQHWYSFFSKKSLNAKLPYKDNFKINNNYQCKKLFKTISKSKVEAFYKNDIHIENIIEAIISSVFLRYTDKKEIAFVNLATKNTRNDISEISHYYVPLYVNEGNNQTVLDVAKQIQHFKDGNKKYFDVPLYEVFKKLKKNTNIDFSHAFKFVIARNENLEPVFLNKESLANLEEIDYGYYDNDLTINYQICDDKIKICLAYRTSLHNETVMQSVLNSIEKLCCWSAENVKKYLNDFFTSDQFLQNYIKKCKISHNSNFDIEIKGNTVNLLEVEKILNKHKKVEESRICLTKNIVEQGYSLIAYVKEKSNFLQRFLGKRKEYEKELQHKIMMHLKTYLHNYMVPEKIIFMESIPKIGKAESKFLKNEIKNNEIKNTEELINLRMVDIKFDNENKKLDTDFVASVEFKLKEMWVEVLGVSNFKIYDDFFAIGGNSLNVIQLASKVNKNLNLDLPVVWFYQNKTISSQANYILSKCESDLYTPIIHLTKNKAKEKIFFAHTSISGAEIYANLANNLEGKMECYGIDNYNLNKSKRNIFTLDELVDFYITNIKMIQKSGPYNLLGWSNGGLLAFEIAKKLIDLGNEVNKLYLLDTYFKGLTYHNIIDVISMVNFDSHFKKFCDSHMPQKIAYRFKNLPKPYRDKIGRSLEIENNFMSKQKITEYKGDVVFIKAKTYYGLGKNKVESLLNIWRENIENFKIFNTNLDHFDFMVEEHAKGIADIVLENIDVNFADDSSTVDLLKEASN